MVEELVAVLADTPLCAGLDEDELRRLAGAGRVERWAEGAVVMEEGEAGPRLVLLLDGRAAVIKRDADGAEHVLATVGPGGVLGEMSLLAHTLRTATVRATSPIRLFAMDRITFDEMCADGDPAALKLALSIARVLSDRLDRLNERVVGLLAEHGGDDAVVALETYREGLFSRSGHL